MKIALVHDWLIRLGGAERVLIALHKIFPEAPVYTLFYSKKFVSRELPGAKIIPSFLQKIPRIQKFYPWFKILMPSAVESLDLSDFDVVISSSHEVSHGVLVKQKTKHICFYHSPSRILWDRTHEYVVDFRERAAGEFKLSLIRLGQHFLRLWDWQAGQRPDISVANSKYVAERLKKYYGREAKVIYPPVALGEHSARSFSGIPAMPSEGVGRFASLPLGPSQNGLRIRSPNIPPRLLKNYFLIVSQLYPHKNIDLAVEAFKFLNDLNLVIVGEGPEKKRLKKMIGDSVNIKLLGFVPDEKLAYYYQNCLAYIICNEEDFGISPIEAFSFGKPVLAFKLGGAAETNLKGVTGEFFEHSKPELLAEAIKAFNKNIKNGVYVPEIIKEHSRKFGFERFKKEILDLVPGLGYNEKT